jgi:hypothetical protein
MFILVRKKLEPVCVSLCVGVANEIIRIKEKIRKFENKLELK